MYTFTVLKRQEAKINLLPIEIIIIELFNYNLDFVADYYWYLLQTVVLAKYF